MMITPDTNGDESQEDRWTLQFLVPYLLMHKTLLSRGSSVLLYTKTVLYWCEKNKTQEAQLNIFSVLYNE